MLLPQVVDASVTVAEMHMLLPRVGDMHMWEWFRRHVLLPQVVEASVTVAETGDWRGIDGLCGEECCDGALGK